MTRRPAVPFLDLPRQHALIREELDAAIASVIDRGDFVKGAAVGRFEEQFSSFQQAEHCVAVGNGTDALEIALASLDLPPGSEVIVPANSFIATSEAVSNCGLRVVFADVDSTLTLDVSDVESRITDRTSAVVAVHLYGQPANIPALKSICSPRGIRLVEDSAQAHGAEIGGSRVGALGDIGTFSFFPGKNLGAFGDAGAIVTNCSELATRARRISDHGRVAKYDHEREGRNSRMDTLQAAVLLVKLPHLDAWVDLRNAAASHYRKELAQLGGVTLDPAPAMEEQWSRPVEPGRVKVPAVRGGIRHAYHLFVIRVPDRDVVQRTLATRGIATGIHYPAILPRLKAYSGHPQHAAPFGCDGWAGELLSLPMGDHLDGDMVDAVVASLASVVAIDRDAQSSSIRIPK